MPGCDAEASAAGLCAVHEHHERLGARQVDYRRALDLDDYYDDAPNGGRRVQELLRPPVIPFLAPPDQSGWRAGEHGSRYGLAVLGGTLGRLDPREGRNNALTRASYTLAGWVAGGSLDGPFTLACLAETAEQLCPDELAKARASVAQAFRRGLTQPRTAPAPIRVA